MKKMLLPLFLLAAIVITLLKIDRITFYTSKLISSTPQVYLNKPNEYTTNNNYFFVQKTKDFVPYSKQDIINIFYSFLDNGYTTFTFYCPSEYTECISDITNLINNQSMITDIGNFVHPFNNFSDVYLTTSSTGEINIKIKKTYSDDQVDKIEKKIDEIIKNIITDDMDIHDRILKVHDYIIDSTNYDISDKNSENAYNLLFEGKSKCSGYADTLAIFLHKFGIKNYKIGSEKHVWNAIYIDGKWQQVDVTWDDPVIQNGETISNTIRHKFYMIDTKTLLSYDTTEHNFDTKIYFELQ